MNIEDIIFLLEIAIINIYKGVLYSCIEKLKIVSIIFWNLM